MPGNSFSLNLFPGKNTPGVFLQRTCGIGNDEDQSTLVGMRRTSLLADHAINEGFVSFFILNCPGVADPI
jgi:hypothetical protein